MTTKLVEALQGAGAALSQDQGPVSRRRLATLGATALGSVAARAFSSDPLPSPAPPPGDYAPGIVQNWTNAGVRLARRISFGVDATFNKKARIRGFTRILEEQLNFTGIQDSICENVVNRRWPRVNMTMRQLRDLGDDWVTQQHLEEATIYRAVYSQRFLYQRMCEFWADHFSTWSDKVGGPLQLHWYRDCIQRHAMGNFYAMLRSVAFSPAMLEYLDNADNDCNNPNVNFARELMELHSVSVKSGYTPDDILSVALCFTGWGWEWDRDKGTWGTYKYNPDHHVVGAKVVLGQIIPNGQREQGEAVLSLLFKHPSCATFVCTKLCKYFLGDGVTTNQINAAAAEFRRTNGDIRSVLRKILTVANIMGSEPKFKRPFHLIVNACKSLKVTIDEMWNLKYHQIGGCGHYPFAWETPDGYPDRFDFWGPSMGPRLSFAFEIANNRVWGVQGDLPTMIGADRDPDRVLQILNDAFFGGEMANADRDALEAYLRGGLLDDERLRGAAALCIGSPSFQWY